MDHINFTEPLQNKSMVYPESRCNTHVHTLYPKYSKVFLQLPSSLPLCVHWVCAHVCVQDLEAARYNIGNCLLYLAIYYHFSLEGPLAFKSAAGCLIVEDSLLGPLNCSPRTMDSFVNVFLFLSLDNTGGSFWLSALKKCLQNYTSLYASQNK